MEEVSERLKVRAILEEPADCAYGNWVQAKLRGLMLAVD